MANTSLVIQPKKNLHVDDKNVTGLLTLEHKNHIIYLLKKVSKDKNKDCTSDRCLRQDARAYIKILQAGKQELTPAFMDRCSFVYHMLESLDEISKMTKDEFKERIYEAQVEMVMEDLMDD